MEKLCYYVNSRGILKSCDFYSPNPKSSCNNDIPYLFLMLKSQFNGMSIYVCSDLLRFFVNTILPKINNKFVLVSGDSDMCVPREALNIKETSILLKSHYLIRWFIQNTQIQDNDKIIQLPIGLDYHTILSNKNHQWKLPNESHLPEDQENILVNIKEKIKPFYERIPKIYVNFSKNNDRFGDRKKSLESIADNILVINNDFTPRTINWQNITKYTFVLSPFGVGMDCHRTWEALCLGCIPIVRAPNFKKMFEDLPVLIVDNWSDINQNLLQKTIEEFRAKEFNYGKLTLSYWINKIRNVNK
jgi:hypothetical protein